MNNITTVLLVIDKYQAKEFVQNHLTKAGYRVFTTSTQKDAMNFVREYRLDLVMIFDSDLSWRTSSVAQKLRQSPCGDELKICVCSLGKNIENICYALDEYADDYIEHVDPRLIVSKVNSFFRRLPSNRKTVMAHRRDINIFKKGNLSLNSETMEVKVNNDIINLKHNEFNVLSILGSENRAFSRDEIISVTKGINSDISPRSIDKKVSILRKKLSSMDCEIKTVSGIGYRLLKK